MTIRMKTVIAATAVSLGLATAPVSAQVLGTGYDGRAIGYNDDGTLNVFGAHIDPRGARGGGLVGGVGNVVGGVVGGVGSAVGGVVGGVTGAADDVVTGSIGERGVGRSRAGMADDEGLPVSRYNRSGYGRPSF